MTPYEEATAKFRLVRFELTRNGVLILRLYTKFSRNQFR